jgi:pimeloyl-ACP methyl ester carboxylesterase
MGGNLAVDLAAELPGIVSGMILIDAIPCMRELMMPGVPAESLQYESPYNDRMIGMSDADFLSYATTMASNMTATEEKIAEIASWSVKADRETYVYGYTDLLKLDLRDKLSGIEVPTLILGAAFPDATTVRKTYESQYGKLKDKQIAIVEDSRHFIMFDQPEWLYQQIDQYLSDNGKRQ